MKKLYLGLTCFFYINVAFANTFYFSSSLGDDSRSSLEAQNQNTPWKTLNKLNSYFRSLNPGDSVLFKRGDTFEGSLAITKSGLEGRPITIATYGAGEKPLFSGLVSLSGWSSAGNGIWEASCASCDPELNLLLINGQPKDVGRFPNKDDVNKGYLSFEDHSGTNQITDHQLTSSPDWTGGEVVIRKKRWIIDKNKIITHAGNNIVFSSTPDQYEAANDFGYFIQRHPLTLDQEGEWYFDRDNKRVKVHFGSNNPSGFDVKASVVNNLVLINNQSNIVFEGLWFSGANVSGFDILDASNIEVKDCSITFSGTNGITASGTNHLSIKSCYVGNSFNNALDLGPACVNSQVFNNNIVNTGLSAGMGKSGDEAYEAIIIKGSDNLVNENRIQNTGYIPVRFEGNSTEIRNNFINNFDLVKDDGGGIYTYKQAGNSANFGRKITGNIILNGRGASEGTNDPNDIHAPGIYMDDQVDNIQVTENTVAFCSSGIYAHNANNILMHRNTLYHNRNQMLMVHDYKAENSPIRNLDVDGNILFARDENETALHIESIKDDIQQFGRFDNNYYSRPLSDNFVINTSYKVDNTRVYQTYNLGGWRERFGMDVNSKEAAATIPTYVINSLDRQNKYNNGQFNNNLSGVSNYSQSENCKIAWNNEGKLDGGALAVSFNSKQEGYISQVIVRVGALSAGKDHILRFSLLGSSINRKLKVFLRNSFSPYNKISEVKSSIISQSRVETEVLLSTTSDVSNGCIVFELEDAGGEVWMDNIELYEANVSIVDPAGYIRFEYNASKEQKRIPIVDTYFDVKGSKYAEELVLQPFSSLVLLKQPQNVQSSLKKIEFSGKATDQGTKLQWNSPDKRNEGFFDVERSVDGLDFTTIGRVIQTGQRDYTYYSNLLPGKNFYRLRQVQNQGNADFSKIILIENLPETTLRITPNPVNNILKVDFAGQEIGKDASVIIQNLSGIHLKKVPVQSFGRPFSLDVSSLNSGFYVLKIIADGKTVTKTFIKN